MKHKAVIIGAGALGLGFLAERMAGDYDIFLADTSAKADVLNQVRENQGFTVNICGLDGIMPTDVKGSFDAAVVDTDEGRAKYERALREADLVLTVTGRKILDKIVQDISPILNCRDKKGWILFCENGLNIAESFAGSFGHQTVLVDTVMSRMCRFAGDGEAEYQPLCSGSDEALVVEDYSLLPVDRNLCSGGPFTDVFSLVSTEEFLCWEDIKLYLHNGMHAFVSYHAFLEGVEYFSETPETIRDRARSVVLEEVVSAIARTHPCTSREEIEAYGLQLLGRFFNPYFHDTVERGVRGVEEKLAPGERLLGGCEFIRRAGIEPTGYASTITAAKKILGIQQRSSE